MTGRTNGTHTHLLPDSRMLFFNIPKVCFDYKKKSLKD